MDEYPGGFMMIFLNSSTLDASLKYYQIFQMLFSTLHQYVKTRSYKPSYNTREDLEHMVILWDCVQHFGIKEDYLGTVLPTRM